MILKFAFRNLSRLAWRTLLYGFTIFFIVTVMTASLFVYGACINAEKTLEENYVFVASLVKKENADIPLTEIFRCVDADTVSAFNVSMSECEGVIPNGRAMTEAPSATVKGEKKKVWIDHPSCKLLAVENLALTYPFFTGECTIREGTALTTDGYFGNRDEIVIPWWFADQYNVRVGDEINRRYRRSTGFAYLKTTVVGIYESSASNPETGEYPAYIPLAVAELDYGRFNGKMEDAYIERADFVLSSRDSFGDFVAFADENGIDFKTTNIVFNNSTYDVLSSELSAVSGVALLVFMITSLAGLGLLIFATVYLCHTRKQERILLRALGMKKSGIYRMIATELLVILSMSVCLGLFGGKLSAEGVCHTVNSTVLARASASETIQTLGSAGDFDITMPLEKNMQIEISTDEPRVSDIGVDINFLRVLKENEVGISRHTYYLTKLGSEADRYFYYGHDPYDENVLAINARDYVPITFVGISDLSLIDCKMNRTLPEGYGFVSLYVSETSPWAKEDSLFISDTDKGDFTLIDFSGIQENTFANNYRRYIVGTYKDNEYCSGTDILVSLDDYHLFFSKSSVTDEEHHFKRIHEIFQKEE